MTPYEALTGTKPKVGHLHDFMFCNCYVPKMNNKTRSEVTEMRVMGYSDQRKGYRLYDSRKK